MKPILEIHNIGKKYRISHEAQQPYLSLRDSISGIFKGHNSKEDFWALKDVSFDVYPGESIGIIGKNGAGKSTLLKILSKITPPTNGNIIARGRIAALLEVGTGFHPELTGRENIFMNGSILGMKRQEIIKNFDSIVDFSGVERFLDTPLKHYSSGMQLRLAFSVAAFLENEILIIDEVLAVGDVEFQKKCMTKMDEVSHSGRTILFVSHNMNAIRQLCSKTVLLKGGQVHSFGDTKDMLREYSQTNENQNYINGAVEISGKVVKMIQLFCDETATNTLYTGCDFKLKVNFKSDHFIDYPVLGVVIRDEYDEAVIGVNNKNYLPNNIISKPIKSGTLEMHIPFMPLLYGKYSIDIHLGDSYRDIEVLKNCFNFNVISSGINKAIELPNENLNQFLIEKINWNCIQ